jgi:hypothetical protein
MTMTIERTMNKNKAPNKILMKYEKNIKSNPLANICLLLHKKISIDISSYYYTISLMKIINLVKYDIRIQLTA